MIQTESSDSNQSVLFECQTCKTSLNGRDMRKHIMDTRHKCCLYLDNGETIQCEDCSNDNVHMLQLVRLGGFDLKCLCKLCLQKSDNQNDVSMVDNAAYYDVAQNGQLFQYWGSYIDFSNVKCDRCQSEDNLNISSKPNSSAIRCDGCLKKTGDNLSNYHSESSGKFLYKFLNMKEPSKKPSSSKNSKFQRNKKSGSSKRVKQKKELSKQQIEDKKYQDIKAKNRTLQKSDINLSQFKGLSTGRGPVPSVLSSVIKPKKGESAKKTDHGKSSGTKSNQKISSRQSDYPSKDGNNRASKKDVKPIEKRSGGKETGKTQGTLQNKPVVKEVSSIKERGDFKKDFTKKTTRESKNDTKNDTKKDNTKDGKKNVNSSTKKDVKSEAKKDKKNDVKISDKKEPKKDTKKDTKKDFNKDVQKDTKKESKAKKESKPKEKSSSDTLEEGTDLFAGAGGRRLNSSLRTKFSSIDEYLDYLSYFFFLEQRFELEREFLTRFDLEWGVGTDRSSGDQQVFKIVLPYSHKAEQENEYQWPEHFIKLRRLPFTKNQGMILVRNLEDGSKDFKNDYDRYKDNFWYCSVVDIKPVTMKDLYRRKQSGGHGSQHQQHHRRFRNRKAPKVVKKDVIGFEILLSVFPWCTNLKRKLPVSELSTNFKILPCVEQMNRVFGAMSKIENPDFKRLLVGQDSNVKDVHYKNNLKYFNNNLNDSQVDSIQHSLNNKVTIIQGPPGTGKTSTIVEIIKQLVLTLRNVPILVVAASNIAIDNIAEKLLEEDTSMTTTSSSTDRVKILRILATSRESQYLKSSSSSSSSSPSYLNPIDLGDASMNIDTKSNGGSISTSTSSNSTRDKLLDSCLHNIISSRMSDQDKRLFQKFIRNDIMDVEYGEMTKMLDRRTKISDQIVLQSQVILTTNVASGGKNLHVLDKIPYVIMDESTQSNEPYSLIPLSLPGIKRFIFVGDTKQLSNFSNIKELSSSLFERIIDNKMIETPKILNTQCRMNPKISQFPIKEIYENKLFDGVLDDLKKRLSPSTYPLYFLDYSSTTSGINKNIGENLRLNSTPAPTTPGTSTPGSTTPRKKKSLSFYNAMEGEYIITILKHLVNELSIEKSKITIITPYSGQREYLSELLLSHIHELRSIGTTSTSNTIERENYKDELYKIEQTTSMSNTINIIDGISVSSIDAYQGHENDVIIFSTVRSEPKNGTIGFLNDMRRLNVAITRAKKSLIIVGNLQTLKKHGEPIWQKYCSYLESQNVVFQDFTNYHNDFSTL